MSDHQDTPLLLAELKRLREDNKKLHDAINGCAYANMQGSALDLYCESMVERCSICDENVESGCDHVEGGGRMKHYNITDKNLHHLIKDPAFWKSLKQGDEVCGREVVREANDTACGWPQLNDLMDDEGRGWMVCRAGFHEPWCGCEGDEHLEEYE